MRRFLIDNQLPAALGRWLETRGYEAEHVLDLAMAQTPDASIWEYAAAHGAIIVTKDEDFAQLTVLRDERVAVVWIRLGNCRTKTLLDAWAAKWPEMLVEIERGSRLIEMF